MPETLDDVIFLLQHIPENCRPQVSLLVVPGLHWDAHGIDQLRFWQAQGFELAGHGWSHRCRSIRGVYHRLHAAFISRDCAEHLALCSSELVDLLQRNYHWFESHGLSAPELYVPPAWAMGRLSSLQLQHAPFRYFENTAGIYDSQAKQYRRLGVVGYEADTCVRQYVLSGWNALNHHLISVNRPVRISIHPNDHRLRLSRDLFSVFEKLQHREYFQAVNYRTLFTS